MMTECPDKRDFPLHREFSTLEPSDEILRSRDPEGRIPRPHGIHVHAPRSSFNDDSEHFTYGDTQVSKARTFHCQGIIGHRKKVEAV